jgi:hypothetical protein
MSGILQSFYAKLHVQIKKADNVKNLDIRRRINSVCANADMI